MAHGQALRLAITSIHRSDFDREERPAFGGEHRQLGYGRAACEIKYPRGIRGRRVPVFASINRPGCGSVVDKHREAT